MRRVQGSLTSLALAAALLAQPVCALGDPKIGEAPPDDLGLIDTGKDLSLGTLRGKVVIVSFFASWCGPCMEELPILEKIQKIEGQNHLQVVMINVDEDDDIYSKVKKAFEGSPMLLTYDERSRISRSFGVRGIPHMVIIDKAGRIAHIHSGYRDSRLDGLVDELNALLTQGTEAAQTPDVQPAASGSGKP